MIGCIIATSIEVERLPRTEFIQKIGSSASALKGLCEQGVLEIVVQEVSRLEVSKEEVEDVHALSGAQEKVFGDIQRVLQGEGIVSCCRA